MLSLGSKDSEILQLKKIINGSHSDDEQLELLKEFEVCRSLKQFEILSRICELVPLAASIPMIKDIISVFFRKLVSLLDEGKVLQNSELSKSFLECLKSFWSLCSRQQNIVTSSQSFGKWHPKLLEEITPLASVFTDLFISAYGHKEDRALWSRRLYSWLNFDLPDRAIKVALLEAEGHDKDGAELVGPLLRQVLQRKFDSSSNPEYLLHFLLLKKWQGLSSLSDIKEVSKFLKAPTSFLAWLKTYWTAGTKYIPQDTLLEGAEVSQFLLQLKTENVLESLTDGLQMAVFPENVEGQPRSRDLPGSLMFVVDKKGNEEVNEVKMSEGEMSNENKKEKKALTEVSDNHDSHSTVKPGKKRTVSETSNSPEKRRGLVGGKSKDMDEAKSSPKKKRTKVSRDESEEDKSDTIGFFVDRGHSKAEKESISQAQNQSLSKDDDREKVKSGKRRRSLVREESEDENDDEQVEPKRQKQNNDESEDDADDDGNDSLLNRNLRPRNLAAAVLKKKHILISDPVASSYFVSNNGDNAMDRETIQVFESPNSSVSGKGKKTQMNDASLSSPIRSSPRIRNQVIKKGLQSEEGNESPLPRQTNSTPQKRMAESPLIQKRVDSGTKSRKGNESPLIQVGGESMQKMKGNTSALKQKGSESPLNLKKKVSTPQKQLLSKSPMTSSVNSSQKKSAKKTKATP